MRLKELNNLSKQCNKHIIVSCELFLLLQLTWLWKILLQNELKSVGREMVLQIPNTVGK